MDEVDVVHRLRTDNESQRRRYAVCDAIEEQRAGERLNFTIQQSDVTCPACLAVVDTGAICPARRRWWHRRPRGHRGLWRSLDIGNYHSGPCRDCGRDVQQRLSYSGEPLGPWIDTVWLPCDHGVGGVPTPSCMGCANDRHRRGLYR